MWKKECFDRKNYKALENKVNHCRRMPGVDKWRDGNVSTASAICFLCCEFHPSSLLFSFSQPYFSAFSVISLSSSCSSPLHCIFHIYCLFLSFLSLSPPTSLTHSTFTVKFYLWGVRGPGKLVVSWESVITNNTKTEKIDLTFIATVQWWVEKIGAELYMLSNKRGMSKMYIILSI